jgi:hypothetical protein
VEAIQIVSKEEEYFVIIQEKILMLTKILKKRNKDKPIVKIFFLSGREIEIISNCTRIGVVKKLANAYLLPIQ